MLARVPRDTWIGLTGIVAAVLYWGAADGIPISPLDGVVNAGAMPKALAWALGALGALLVVRSVAVELMTAAAVRNAVRASGAAVDEDGEPKASWREHARAAGVAAFALAYIVALPVLGYAVSVAVLVAVVSFYGGATLDWRVPAVGAGAAIIYYAVFVLLLGIPLPPGFWPGLFG
jgi:hypothetical protein